MPGRRCEIQASPDRGPIKTKVLFFFHSRLRPFTYGTAQHWHGIAVKNFLSTNIFPMLMVSLYRLVCIMVKISGVIFVSSFWSSFGMLFFFFSLSLPLLSKAKKVVAFSCLFFFH